MKAGYKIFYNDDLMYLINQFDSTHIESHKLKMRDSILLICETSHSFWYNLYEKSLNECKETKYILQIQDAFFDTLVLLGYEFYL